MVSAHKLSTLPARRTISGPTPDAGFSEKQQTGQRPGKDEEMKTAFYLDSTKTRYTFSFPDDGNSDEITIVRTRPDNEQVAVVKVFDSPKYDEFEIRGKRVWADGGAYALFKMIRECVNSGAIFSPISFSARFIPED